MTETEIARQSLRQFGFAGALRRISDGLDRSYRARTTTRETFALRVSKGDPMRGLSTFTVEARWIDELADNPFCGVPSVRRTKTNRRVGQVRDADGLVRPSTLLDWLPGKRFFGINQDYARRLGRLAGTLHRSTQNRPAPPPEAIKRWDADLMCLMGLKGRIARFPRLASRVVFPVYETVCRISEQLDEADVGLINADLGLHNIVWHERQPAIVDFNDSGVGPYAFCLGRLVERIRLHDDGDGLADTLLSGYREVAALPPAYVEWGPWFELAAAVFKLKFHRDRVSRQGTTLTRAERRTMERLAKRIAYLS